MKLSELKALAAEQLAAYHATQNRIDKLKKRMLKRKQAECPHEKTKEVREQGYFEPGKMSHPLPDTIYKVCCNCKKKLAILVAGAPRFKPLNNK